MLNRILTQAFDQYIFDKVDKTLSIAGAANASYAKAVKEISSVLSQLMALAGELEAQQPELLRLVMEFEAAATLESGMAAEIAYREGLRDSGSVRQEFAAFIEKQC